MSFCSLPFDVLLAIYRKLDTLDVVRSGMTCTALERSTKDRHVWLDQLQNCVVRNPALAGTIPKLHFLTTEELRGRVIHQEKLWIRWNQVQCPPEQFACGPRWFDGRGSMWLLAGGEAVLFVSERGNISLRRIQLYTGHLDVIPFASYTLEGGHRWVWMTVMSENGSSPLLACKEESNCSIQLVSIDCEHGVIHPEAVVRVPKEKTLVRLVRQGRTVVCMLSLGGGSRSLLVINLDSPKRTIEAVLPDSPHASFVCLPRPDVVVIYDQFDIACFRLVDASTMEEGAIVATLTPLWARPNPLATTALIYHVSLVEYADASWSLFEARFVEYRHEANTDTFVSWKIGSLGSSVQNPTVEKAAETVTLPDGLRSLPASSNNSFWSAVAGDNGISFFITPLEDVGRCDGWGTLRFSIPYGEFGIDDGGARAMYLDLDIDRVSGRVIIWWVDEEYPGCDARTQFFILELV